MGVMSGVESHMHFLYLDSGMESVIAKVPSGY